MRRCKNRRSRGHGPAAAAARDRRKMASSGRNVFAERSRKSKTVQKATKPKGIKTLPLKDAASFPQAPQVTESQHSAQKPEDDDKQAEEYSAPAGLDHTCLPVYGKQPGKASAVSRAPLPLREKNTVVRKKAGKRAERPGSRTAEESDCTKKGFRVQPDRHCKKSTRTVVTTGDKEKQAGCSGQEDSGTTTPKRKGQRRVAKPQAALPVATAARKGTLRRRNQAQKAAKAIAAAAPEVFHATALTENVAIPAILFVPGSDEELEDAKGMAADTPRLGSCCGSPALDSSPLSSLCSTSSPDFSG